MSYLDMAIDAGYSGDEAQMVAAIIEQREYEAYLEHCREQEALDRLHSELAEASDPESGDAPESTPPAHADSEPF